MPALRGATSGESPVGRTGQGAAGQGATAGRRWQGRAARRGGADRRPRADLRRKKAADQELGELIGATGTSLLQLKGIGLSGPDGLPIGVGNVTRFPPKGHFASCNVTAPLDACSGDKVRHRRSRADSRQLNRIPHIMATVQLRNATERAGCDRRRASGETSMKSMRCLSPRCPTSLPTHGRRRRPRYDGPGRTSQNVYSPARPARIRTPAPRTSPSQTRQHRA